MNARWIFLAASAAQLLTSASLADPASTAKRDYFTPVPEQIYAGVPFAMPRVPVPKIPERSVSIVDFGAVGDGKFLNTEAFDRAIRHTAEQGGGRVVVPRGIWLTGLVPDQKLIVDGPIKGPAKIRAMRAVDGSRVIVYSPPR